MSHRPEGEGSISSLQTAVRGSMLGRSCAQDNSFWGLATYAGKSVPPSSRLGKHTNGALTLWERLHLHNFRVARHSPTIRKRAIDEWTSTNPRQFVLLLWQIASIPPSAAQGLKQRCRVAITVRLRLRKIDHRHLVRLLGIQQIQIIDIARLILFCG